MSSYFIIPSVEISLGASESITPSFTLLHCKKKVSDFPVPSREVTNQTPPWRGIIYLFPAGESLESDIPAGDGKMANLFFTV